MSKEWNKDLETENLIASYQRTWKDFFKISKLGRNP